MEHECIFCKIASGEIPAIKVYESGDFLAFLDIQPVADGHLLIIPKGHIVWMQNADDATVAGIFKLAKKLMTALKKAVGCDYVMVSVVGKDIQHFHVHLIPRFLDDNHPQFPIKEFKKEDAPALAEKIISAI